MFPRLLMVKCIDRLATCKYRGLAGAEGGCLCARAQRWRASSKVSVRAPGICAPGVQSAGGRVHCASVLPLAGEFIGCRCSRWRASSSGVCAPGVCTPGVCTPTGERGQRWVSVLPISVLPLAVLVWRTRSKVCVCAPPNRLRKRTTRNNKKSSLTPRSALSMRIQQ
jgi:hypothetical protein